MEKNKKYYYRNFLKDSSKLIIVIIITFIFSIVDLIDNEIDIIANWGSWVIVSLTIFCFLISIFAVLQHKKKVGYLEFKDDKIYLQNLIGKIKSAYITDSYQCIEKKEKIKYIKIFDSNRKIQLLIGNAFEIDLKEVVKILEESK